KRLNSRGEAREEDRFDQQTLPGQKSFFLSYPQGSMGSSHRRPADPRALLGRHGQRNRQSRNKRECRQKKSICEIHRCASTSFRESVLFCLVQPLSRLFVTSHGKL